MIWTAELVTRLNELIAEWEARPFAFGESDCALWVAAWVEVATGEDFGAPFRGRYSTAEGAARALREHGAGTLEATITAALGDPVPLAMLGRGDVVMSHERAAGVVMPRGALTMIEGVGMGWMTRDEWRIGWKVG